MLAKKYRLVKSRDFETVFKKGQSFFSKIIILRVAKNKLGYSRFGIIVSTKAAKRAHQRNRIKRWVREIIRLSLPQFKSGLDCVLIAKSTILTVSPTIDYQEVGRNLESLFKKAKLFK